MWSASSESLTFCLSVRDLVPATGTTLQLHPQVTKRGPRLWRRPTVRSVGGPYWICDTIAMLVDVM